jgi:hypothetical protein
MMTLIVVLKGACIHDELTWSWVIALRPQTPMHIKGGWPHYTDTSEPVDGNGAQKYGHCPIRVRNSDLSITGPRAYQLL